MADIFVSYARVDGPQVAPLVAALEAEGWSVWWDPEIVGGQEFDALIARELEAAQAVIVVWTPASVSSRWVRGEARSAADRGVMIPVQMQSPNLPLDARAVHTIDFDDWREDARSRPFQDLLRALRTLVAQDGASEDAHGEASRDRTSQTPSAHAHAPTHGGLVKHHRLDPKRLAAAAIALTLVVALAGSIAWLTRDAWPGRQPVATRLAILPFKPLTAGGAAREFADGLTDELQSVLSTRQIPTIASADAQSLREGDGDRRIKALGVAFLLDGSVRSEGGTLAVNVHLDDAAKHATVWSASLQGPADRPSDLQGQVAAEIGSVLNCGARALRPVRGLSDSSTLALYLHACDLFQAQDSLGFDPQGVYALLGALRQVIARAPDFAAAHSDLAKYEVYFAPDLPADQAPQLRREAQSQARRALALDPKDADAYTALYLDQTRFGWASGERILRQGVDVDPDWPITNGFLGEELRAVGRLREGAAFDGRAAAANPMSPGLGWAPAYAEALAAIGQTGQADDLVAQLHKLWPNDGDVWRARINVALDEGHWSDADAVLDDAAGRLRSLGPRDIEVTHMFLRAARSRTPAAIDAARRTLIDYAKAGPPQLTAAVYDLSALGLVDDAFALTSATPIQASDASYLFVPQTAPLRRDRRFIGLAAKLGLVDYWRSTGKWPDFCLDPSPPYDCKAEAAKLASR